MGQGDLGETDDSADADVVTVGPNLSMTAKEMRNMLASRRKKDPRIDDRMDFRRKHEIIQTL